MKPLCSKRILQGGFMILFFENEIFIARQTGTNAKTIKVCLP